jgi:hypothetical protein
VATITAEINRTSPASREELSTSRIPKSPFGTDASTWPSRMGLMPFPLAVH